VQATVNRVPLLRLMMANAAILSAIYLSVGTAIEVIRRVYPMRWAEHASLAMDALPARVLEICGLLTQLRHFYAQGHLSEFWLRFAFGAVAIGVIFFLGAVVGGAMAALRRMVRR
jgi:hypothetical protein